VDAFSDDLHDYLAQACREIDQAEGRMVAAALMATDPDRRHLFRWRHAPQPVQTGVATDLGAGSNDLTLWAEIEPPEVWCDLHADPDEPLTVTPDGAVYGRLR